MRPALLHIPKTGGTSVKNLMLKNYLPERVMIDNSWEVRNRLLQDPDSFNSYAAFAGHIPLRYYQSFLDEDLLFFAFVRNPVERRMSHYMYCRRTKDHPLHAYAAGLKFEAFVRQDNMVNEQCDYFIHDAESSHYADDSIFFIETMPNLLAYPVEKLGEAMRYLSHRLNWVYQSAGFDNVSKPEEKPEVTPETRELIEINDAEDLKLYNWVSENPERAGKWNHV
jgi:hypothetical protein